MPFSEKNNRHSESHYNNDYKRRPQPYSQNPPFYGKPGNEFNEERENHHQKGVNKKDAGESKERPSYYDKRYNEKYHEQYKERNQKNNNRFDVKYDKSYDNDKGKGYSRRGNHQDIKCSSIRRGENKHEPKYEHKHENKRGIYSKTNKYGGRQSEMGKNDHDSNKESRNIRNKDRQRERNEGYNIIKRDNKKENENGSNRKLSTGKKFRRDHKEFCEEDSYRPFCSTGKYEKYEQYKTWNGHGRQEPKDKGMKRMRDYFDANNVNTNNENEKFTKKILNAAEVIEKKNNNIELSRYIFLYKIPTDVTEEEIDEIIRDIAIKEAFSLPTNIYINKISYFTIRDDIFLKENLEYLKNNSYFNYIQQNILSKKKEDHMHDDTCCIIEFPCEEATNKLFSLFEKEQTMEIKNSLCYIFPLFKLTKKRNKTINEDNKSKKVYMDWYCSFCNFFNFSKRLTCHFCKAAQTEGSKIVENEAIDTANFLNNNMGITDISYFNTDINKESYNPTLSRVEQNSFGVLPTDLYKEGYVNRFDRDNEVKRMNHINHIDNTHKGGGIVNNLSSVNTNYRNVMNEGNVNTMGMTYDFCNNVYRNYNNSAMNSNDGNDNFYDLQKVKADLCGEEKTEMLIVKGLDGNLNDKEILQYFETVFDKTKIEHCYLFNDIKGSNKKRGFCFIKFVNSDYVTKVMDNAKGNHYINFQNNNLKIDYVNVKEKEAFFNCIELAKLNIESSAATAYNNRIRYFNFFVSYFEIPIINTTLFYYYCFLKWTFQIIIWKTGKPQLNEFYYDSISGYYYHPVYQLYFDEKTKFYMSLSTGYYVWNDQTELLVRVYPDDYAHMKNTTYTTTDNNGDVNREEMQKNKYADQVKADTLQNNTDLNNRNSTISTNRKPNSMNEKESTHTKISLFVKSAKKVALASKKTIEQMNQIENVSGKKKAMIEQHFNTDFDSEEEYQKEKQKQKDEQGEGEEEKDSMESRAEKKDINEKTVKLDKNNSKGIIKNDGISSDATNAKKKTRT